VLVISNSCFLNRSLNAFKQVLGDGFLTFEGVIHVLDLVVNMNFFVLVVLLFTGHSFVILGVDIIPTTKKDTNRFYFELDDNCFHELF
jgi:hypothetical protein